MHTVFHVAFIQYLLMLSRMHLNIFLFYFLLKATYIVHQELRQSKFNTHYG